MRQKEDKKDLERRAVESYLNYAGVTPLSLQPWENPDFILEHNGKRIFIEHTLLMCKNGAHSLSREAGIKEFIKTAKELYDERNPEHPVSLNFQFNFKINIAGKKRKLAIEAFLACLDNYPKNEVSKLYGYHGLPDFIDELEIIPFPLGEKCYWFDEDVRLYGELRKEEFITPVDKKNAKAISVEWSENYDEAWLLLEAGVKHGSYADYKVNAEWINPNWVFSRIIIYDGFGDKNGVKFYEVIK
jgi:hypothetical protein